MPKFRKKPVVVEAIQWTDNMLDFMPIFHMAQSVGGIIELQGKNLVVYTLEGAMKANVSDWIIKGVKGELYLCKPDIFAATYDVVEDTQ